jgi:hypothetical protein
MAKINKLLHLSGANLVPAPGPRLAGLRDHLKAGLRDHLKAGLRDHLKAGLRDPPYTSSLTELNPNEDARRRQAGRLPDRRHIEPDLPAIPLFAIGGEHAVALVVDDHPPTVFLEGEIDNTLDERAVGHPAGDRRFTAAHAAPLGRAGARHDVVRQHAPDGARRVRRVGFAQPETRASTADSASS